MAEGGNVRGKKGFNFPPFPTIGVDAVTLTGSALAGAVVVFGMKKIYNYISSSGTKEDREVIGTDYDEKIPIISPTVTQTIPEIRYEDYSDECKVDSPSEESHKGSEAGESSNEGLESRNVDKNLHDSLLHYYNSYVQIPDRLMQESADIVVDIKERFQMFLHEIIPSLHIRGLHDTGSAIEGLQVVRPNEFDINITLNIDPNVWMLVDAGQTILGAHGYWLVRRVNIEFFTLGNSPYDKFLVGEYLSPNKVKLAFQDFTNRVGKWSSNFKVQANVIGTDVQLTISYNSGQTFTIDFRPSVFLGNVQVIAKAHPLSKGDESYSNLWRQTFFVQELDKMHTSRENGCQTMCLKLLKAIRLNHPDQLGLLPSYVFKTVVLHLLDAEDDWDEEALSERFLDTLKYLEGCLKEHYLPHYLCPQLNILENIDPDAQDMLSDFISHIIEKRQFQWLLKCAY